MLFDQLRLGEDDLVEDLELGLRVVRARRLHRDGFEWLRRQILGVIVVLGLERFGRDKEQREEGRRRRVRLVRLRWGWLGWRGSVGQCSTMLEHRRK